MERSTEPKATSDVARLNRVQMARALREGAGAEDGRGAEQRMASVERNWSMDGGLRRVGARVTLGVLLASTLTGGRITALRADFLQHTVAGGGQGGSIPGSPGPSVGIAGQGHSPIQDTNQEQQKTMFSKLTGVTAAIAVGASVTVAGATDRLVPTQYSTIQAAIDAAQAGDRVLVSAGTYREQVNLSGKRISLEGIAGSASTIIEGDGVRTNIVGSGEPDGCVVAGFTIQGGRGDEAGGILLSNSGVRIHHCVFRDNQASSPWGGAGFRSAAGASIVEDCLFTANVGQNQSTSAGWYHINGGSFTLRRCVFDGNTSNASGAAGGTTGGVVAKANPEFSSVTGSIEDCVFLGQMTGDPTPSEWGPITVHASLGSPIRISGCTFVAPPGGQTFAVLPDAGSRVAIENCTGCGFDFAVYAEAGSTGTVTNSDFSPTCADCNHNSVADLQEIVRGDVADVNANRIPDVCEIPGCRDVDLFRDGAVNGADLGILQAQWGIANENTVSDIDHNGRVDGSDLGTLLAFWGPCGG